MKAETNEQAANHDISEELRDVLIAISVVAKRLAMKIEESEKIKGEKQCSKDMD